MTSSRRALLKTARRRDPGARRFPQEAVHLGVGQRLAARDVDDAGGDADAIAVALIAPDNRERRVEIC
jgi:hypothetical protein